MRLTLCGFSLLLMVLKKSIMSTQKEIALRAVRDANRYPYKVAANMLAAEGFKPVPGGSWELQVDNETISWVPSAPTEIISGICSAIVTGETGIKEWENLRGFLRLTKKEAIIPSKICEGIFVSFASIVTSNQSINVKEVTKGIEVLIPYMKKGEDFDPWVAIERFRNTFPLN